MLALRGAERERDETKGMLQKHFGEALMRYPTAPLTERATYKHDVCSHADMVLTSGTPVSNLALHLMQDGYLQLQNDRARERELLCTLRAFLFSRAQHVGPAMLVLYS